MFISFFGFYYLFTLVNSFFNLEIPGITDVSRVEAYITLRNGIFDIIFVIFIIIPTLALIRMIVINRNDQDEKLTATKNKKLTEEEEKQRFRYLIKKTTITVIPLLALFWILPVLLLTIWDVLKKDITKIDILKEFIDTFSLHLVDPFSILFGNFLVITLIAIIAVGFAEGLFVETIFYFAATDPNIQSRIKTIIKVITVVFVWIGFLFSNLGELWNFLINQIRLVLPEFPFPNLWLFLEETVFSFITEVIETWFPILLPLTLLFLPLYIIVTGIYRFYSITLITDMVERFDYFIILITTVYVLIFVELLAVILTLDITTAPLQSFMIDNLIETIIAIIGVAEAIFFCIGVVYLPIYIYKQRQKYQERQTIKTTA
jgi:hypothetical protein